MQSLFDGHGLGLKQVRYYRGAHAAVVVFDITSADSFARAQNWVKELQRKASPDVVIALAGNKVDCANQRTVSTQVNITRVTVVSEILQEARAYAEENGCLYMETSAKTAQNVNELFLAIGILIQSY